MLDEATVRLSQITKDPEQYKKMLVGLISQVITNKHCLEKCSSSVAACSLFKYVHVHVPVYGYFNDTLCVFLILLQGLFQLLEEKVVVRCREADQKLVYVSFM